MRKFMALLAFCFVASAGGAVELESFAAWTFVNRDDALFGTGSEVSGKLGSVAALVAGETTAPETSGSALAAACLAGPFSGGAVIFKTPGAGEVAAAAPLLGEIAWVSMRSGSTPSPAGILLFLGRLDNPPVDLPELGPYTLDPVFFGGGLFRFGFGSWSVAPIFLAADVSGGYGNQDDFYSADLWAAGLAIGSHRAGAAAVWTRASGSARGYYVPGLEIDAGGAFELFAFGAWIRPSMKVGGWIAGIDAFGAIVAGSGHVELTYEWLKLVGWIAFIPQYQTRIADERYSLNGSPAAFSLLRPFLRRAFGDAFTVDLCYVIPFARPLELIESGSGKASKSGAYGFDSLSWLSGFTVAVGYSY